jgi:beta-glucosidase
MVGLSVKTINMRRPFVLSLAIILLLSACGRVVSTPVPTIEIASPIPVPPTETNIPDKTTIPTAPVSTITPTVPNVVKNLLGQMTLDEKIGQMTQVVWWSFQPGDITRYFFGSVFAQFFDKDWAKRINSYQQEALATRLGIPIIYGVDAVHGNAFLLGATVFPQEIGLGATRDATLVMQIGQATAEEMLASGDTWNFAPILAVPQDIRWGRTYEAFGEDTDLVSELGSAYLEGLQSFPDGYNPAPGQDLYVLATPKHFLGDGGTAFGTSTYVNNETKYLLDRGNAIYDESAVRELFLRPYQAVVNSGAKSVMVSYSSLNGTKMHALKYWITDVLKGELGFTGFVVSDWGGIEQIGTDYYAAVVTAINAGIDMSMVPVDYRQFIDTMKLAVEKGDITQERINDAVRRILTVKYELGLFDHPYPDPALKTLIGSDEHHLLARQAVRESLVLLKNDNAALPLAKDARTIYIAGQGADDIRMQCGGWTTGYPEGEGDIPLGTTLLEGIQSVVSREARVMYNTSGEFDGMADVGIVVVGEQPYAEGLGDTSDLRLTSTDIQTIANLRFHSQKLVVIILSGRPLVITKQFQSADAWVAAWLPGTEGAGVADVLFGDFPFTGKLSYTWPRSNDQLPINKNNSSTLTDCAAPLFPYGYGLGEAGSQPVDWLDCP